jgi:catechol 2,3-dioxygenase-like lactoylglutathione lyase family enzyme
LVRPAKVAGGAVEDAAGPSVADQASLVSIRALNVADVPASAAFLTSHFGFRQEMAADGFASLAREDAGMHVAFVRRGLPLLPEEGVDITMPLREEPWGERAFQVTDPNGVIVQLLDWNAPFPSARSRPGPYDRSMQNGLQGIFLSYRRDDAAVSASREILFREPGSAR